MNEMVVVSEEKKGFLSKFQENGLLKAITAFMIFEVLFLLCDEIISLTRVTSK